MGLISLSVFVASNMLGSSLFLLPGALVAYGYYSWIGWIICTGCALSLAIVLAEMSVQYGDGGPCVYVKEVYGERYGSLIGIAHAACLTLQMITVWQVMIRHLRHLCYCLGFESIIVIQTISIILLTLSNGLAQQSLWKSMNVLNFCKFALIGILLVLGVPHISSECCYIKPASALASPYIGICGAISIIVFAFSGIEFGTIVHKEADAGKTIFWGMLTGTICAACVFVLMQAVVWSLLPSSPDMHTPLAHTARILMGKHWEIILAAFGVLCCFAMANSSALVIKALIIWLAGENITLYGGAQRTTTSFIDTMFGTLAALTVFRFKDSGLNALVQFSDWVLAVVFLVSVTCYVACTRSQFYKKALGVLGAFILFAASSAGLFM